MHCCGCLLPCTRSRAAPAFEESTQGRRQCTTNTGARLLAAWTPLACWTWLKDFAQAIAKMGADALQ
eukprot:6248765-Alexandrium_andersonii.AAC.1